MSRNRLTSGRSCWGFSSGSVLTPARFFASVSACSNFSPSIPITVLPNIWMNRRRASSAKRSSLVSAARPLVVSSLRPRLRTVSIMPGIENLAPDRTLTRSGLCESPKPLPVCRSRLLSAVSACSHMPGGNFPLLARYARQASVVMVNPGGTGIPARVISAAPAPLPPSRSRIFADPSLKGYTHFLVVAIASNCMEDRPARAGTPATAKKKGPAAVAARPYSKQLYARIMPRPISARKMNSRMSAPMKATTISANRPPTAIPIAPTSQPPRNAPRTPTTMSQMRPMPLPVITLLARNPATRPTRSKTTKFSILFETLLSRIAARRFEPLVLAKRAGLPSYPVFRISDLARRCALRDFELWLGNRLHLEVAKARAVVELPQRPRRPPVPVAQQAHDSRHHERSHQRGVDGDGDRQPDADGLDDHHLGEAEGHEHSEHDRRSARDEACGPLEAARHRPRVVASANVLLVDAADEQHLVVHRQAEHDREQDHRDARVDRLGCEAENVCQVALLEDPHQRSE